MWNLLDKKIKKRFLLGTSQYPSPEIIKKSVEDSGVEIVTVSLRRIGGPQEGRGFWDMLKALPLHFLPNTAGCHSVKEAVTTAQMAREIFQTNWIKLEIIGDDYNLQPDPFALLEGAKILLEEGFEVFPYMTDDLVLAEKLVSVGCKILMPWASPIGSGQGLLNPFALKTLRKRFPGVQLIVDAGIGRPSQAAQVMEMGYDGVLLNSAVSQALDPIGMACAFSKAVEAGRLGFESGLMEVRNFAKPSTPVVGTPFWHEVKNEKTSMFTP
jgi:thiazole synthase